MLKAIIESLRRRSKTGPSRLSEPPRAGCVFELLETRAMLTALPLPSPAGMRGAEHGAGFEHISHDHGTPRPDGPGDVSRHAARHGDSGPRHAPRGHQPPSDDRPLPTGLAPPVHFNSPRAAPPPVPQHDSLALPNAPESHAAGTTLAPSFGIALTPSREDVLPAWLGTGIDSNISLGPDPAATPSLPPGTASPPGNGLLSDGLDEPLSAIESTFGSTGPTGSGGVSSPRVDGNRADSNNLVSPRAVDSGDRNSDVTRTEIAPQAVTGHALDASALYRLPALSLFELTFPSALDTLAHAYIPSTAGEWERSSAADFAFALEVWQNRTSSVAEPDTEADSSDDERLVDIAELWAEPLDSDSRPTSDRDQEESDPDGSESSSADSVVPRSHVLFRDRLRLVQFIQGDLLHPTAAKTDKQRTAARDEQDSGMIELAYRPASAGGASSAEEASTYEDTSEAADRADGLFVRTDGSCARYQAFELASEPAEPTPAEAGIAADAGEKAPSADVEAAPEDAAA